MSRRLLVELAAMVLVVALAGLSILATVGSARSNDLVFCRLTNGDLVVGVTTDCTEAPITGSDGAARLVHRVAEGQR